MSQNDSNTDKRSRKPDPAVIAAVIGALGLVLAAVITGGFGLLSHGTGPNPPPTPSQHATSPMSSSPTPTSPGPSPAATGMITHPAAGAGNIPSPKTLTAAGTVQHLEPGHHLLVFLQFGTQQVYWGGDPDVVVSHSGHWSGTVCVGDPGAITLWLVDLGPEGLAALAKPKHNYWGNGVPFLPNKLAPDVTILNSISVTAVRTPTSCSKPKRPLYG